MKETEVERRRSKRMSGNEQVRVEMQTFLMALASYADRVSADPDLTFEQHHVSLMRPADGTATQPLAKAARSNG